jgi:type IX secretion system PorP/SprF family membrane protein
MATHWYNRANYNPASIARTNYMYLFSSVRQQWTGVEGAPRVYNIQASDYIHDIRSAFGLSFVSDKIGVTQMLNPMLSYAYRIDNNDVWSLSLGISAGAFIRSINGSLFSADIETDPTIVNTTTKYTLPDANAGAEFQNSSFVFGFSSTHLFSKSTNSYNYNSNHRYGYVIYKNNNLKFCYYRLTLQAINRYNLTYMEGNIFVRLKHPTGLMKGPREIFSAGLTYRTTKQITALLGILITPDLRLGYAYDQSLFSGYKRNGTHEIMLEYRIYNKAASTQVTCGTSANWYH